MNVNPFVMDNNFHLKNTVLRKTQTHIKVTDSSNIPQTTDSSNILQTTDSFIIKQMMTFLKIKDDRDLIKGVWLNGAKTAQIEFFQTDSNTYAGRIVWLQEPIDPLTHKPKLDKFNPDTTLRKQPLLGLVNFKNFIYKGRGVWDHGTGYDPTNGKTYNGKMKMNIKYEDINKIRLIGYWKTPLLRRSSLWIRKSLRH